MFPLDRPQRKQVPVHENRSDPRIEPCGTPQERGAEVNKELPTLTQKGLSLR